MITTMIIINMKRSDQIIAALGYLLQPAPKGNFQFTTKLSFYLHNSNNNFTHQIMRQTTLFETLLQVDHHNNNYYCFMTLNPTHLKASSNTSYLSKLSSNFHAITNKIITEFSYFQCTLLGRRDNSLSPSPSLSNSSIIARSSSSVIFSPSSLATRLRFLRLILPLSSSSNNLNALKTSSCGSLSNIQSVTEIKKTSNF